MIPKKLQEQLANISPKWYPTRFKLTLIAMLVMAVAVPLLLLAIPYLEIFNEMAVQPKGKAQGTYGWFTDMQELIADRLPPEGTKPMGWTAYPIDGNDDASRKLAAKTLKNAVPMDEASLAVGEKWFNVFCIVCHGPEARGDGKIVGPDLFPAPPSLHTNTARGFEDGHIFHVITAGQNKMPPYADRLTRDQRWAVVHYVRLLQKAGKMQEERAKK